MNADGGTPRIDRRVGSGAGRLRDDEPPVEMMGMYYLG